MTHFCRGRLFVLFMLFMALQWPLTIIYEAQISNRSAKIHTLAALYLYICMQIFHDLMKSIKIPNNFSNFSISLVMTICTLYTIHAIPFIKPGSANLAIHFAHLHFPFFIICHWSAIATRMYTSEIWNRTTAYSIQALYKAMTMKCEIGMEWVDDYSNCMNYV